MLDWSADLPEVRHPAGAVLIREGEVHGKLFVLARLCADLPRGTLITVVDAPGATSADVAALSAARPPPPSGRPRHPVARQRRPPGLPRRAPAGTRAVATTRPAARHDQRLPRRPVPPVRRPRQPRHGRHASSSAAPPPRSRREPGSGGSATSLPTARYAPARSRLRAIVGGRQTAGSDGEVDLDARETRLACWPALEGTQGRPDPVDQPPAGHELRLV